MIDDIVNDLKRS